MQEELDPYRALRECPVCSGNRLRSESLSVTLKGKTIADCVNLPISEALVLFDALSSRIARRSSPCASSRRSAIGCAS